MKQSKRYLKNKEERINLSARNCEKNEVELKKYIFLFLGFVLFQVITTFLIYPISMRYLIDYITEFGQISYLLEWGQLFLFVVVYVVFYAAFIFYYRKCIRGKDKFFEGAIVFIKSNFKTFLVSKLFLVFTIDIIFSYIKYYFLLNAFIIGQIIPDFIVYTTLMAISDCLFIKLSISNLDSKKYDFKKIKDVFKEFILKPEFIKIIVVLIILKIPYFVYGNYMMNLTSDVEFGSDILSMFGFMQNGFKQSYEFIYNILQVLGLAMSHMYIFVKAAKILLATKNTKQLAK